MVESENYRQDRLKDVSVLQWRNWACDLDCGSVLMIAPSFSNSTSLILNALIICVVENALITKARGLCH